ncbi:hypothetical protein KGF56_003445 [Candida oxycetoniae]|uniref:Alpha-1,2-mannosyltransferase n=1 Tax=Candida oxycetoniae TaxID=497107 RepID=A0AAI9SVI0_9ASCO|nr:uncharacterized protein KGF56_003445 [Candida oxycetoniae]KAI3403722.2 hypothetical protein KGF56_003445 [Candida oxycetoniae]
MLRLSRPSSKFKPTHAILLGISLFTLLNIYMALNSSPTPSIDADSSSTLLKFFNPFSRPKVEDYSIIGYHHDEQTNLVVVKKYLKKHNLNTATDKSNHFWNFIKSDYKSSKYDLKLISSYNNKQVYDNMNQLLDNQFNHSFVEQSTTERKFVKAFQEFFIDLLKTLEDCKPIISPINNFDHYPNGEKIENYYQNLNQMTPEKMKNVNTERLIHDKGKLPIYGGHLRENYQNEMVRSKEVLSMYLTLNTFEKDSLRQSHTKYMKQMMQEWPESLLKYNTFNSFMKGDGIVYLAGGKYDQLAYLSIKLLREQGSILPVEVIVPKREEYDIQFCDKILPTLNGKCKLMTDYVPQSYFDTVINNAKKNSKNVDIKENPHMDPMRALGYQLKNIAIFISSFENILYLDADNLPIKNPDILFANKPFTDKGMVVWPDLWRRSTSPLFYDVTSASVDPNHQVRNSYPEGDKRNLKGLNSNGATNQMSFHDTKGTIPEASSETGQLLISKRIHFKTLVLSLYYNYYGPDFYYPLLSQGAAGEGDKETYIAAAHRLGLPYYQVSEFTREFGPMDKNKKKLQLFGMGQYDPIIDYIQSNPDDKDMSSLASLSSSLSQPNRYFSSPPKEYALHDEDKNVYNYEYHKFKASSLFFLHANWPKYYIEHLFLADERGPVDKGEKIRRRLYGTELKKELGDGYDFELKIMNNLWWCYCEEPLINLDSIPPADSQKRKDICNAIDMHRKFLSTS